MGLRCCRLILRLHDGISEGYNAGGEMRYVGGSLSAFETCLDDLDALVRLARSLCVRVVLQEYSLGCDRVLFYTKQREANMPLILLSPCDSVVRPHGDRLGHSLFAAVRGASLEELVGHVRGLVPAARVFRVEDGDHSLDGCEELWPRRSPCGRTTWAC